MENKNNFYEVYICLTLLCVLGNCKNIIIHYKDENGHTKTYKYTPGIKPTVANEFVQQVHEAVSYVMKNDDEKVFQTIASDISKVNIKQSSLFNDKANMTSYNIEGGSAQYNRETGKIIESSVEATITWNPAAMLLTQNEGTGTSGGIAPSTILLHEADHARGYLAIKTITEYSA